MNRDRVRTAGITVFAAAAAGALAALFVRDQMARQRRNLFHPRAIRRLAALQHMSRQRASIDGIQVLRDFLAWERKPLLRRRARAILSRMEAEAAGPA